MKRLVENLSSLAVGIVIAALAIVVHNFAIASVPVGLLVGLAASVAASKVLGVRFGRRGVRLWFLIGWTALTLRASIFGNGDELLIMANGAGNAFLSLGFLLVLITIWTRL